LAAEVVEACLEARQPLLAALGRELVLLEGLAAPLERLLGAGDLRADRAEAVGSTARSAAMRCAVFALNLREVAQRSQR
jgi:hypothetical protein